ncbi:MAG TPA: family 16 glycoside hydrolase, partial [Urbifossiella sp.]|nr:family 16 glycoside hydrolase [Urbifossiella sp.]
MGRLAVIMLIGAITAGRTPAGPDAGPQTPAGRIALFNGKDLTGFTPWLKDTKNADPRRVFRVTDGLLHITGDGFGYLATEKAYRDYRV